MVICLERGADLHMFQLMPLPLTVSCFSKIQIGFSFLVPAHLGSPGERAVKRVCVCKRVCNYLITYAKINCKGNPVKTLARGPVRLGGAQGPNAGKDATDEWVVFRRGASY